MAELISVLRDCCIVSMGVVANVAVGSSAMFSRPSRNNSFPSERYVLGTKNVAAAVAAMVKTKNASNLPLCRQGTPRVSRSEFSAIGAIIVCRVLRVHAARLRVMAA